MSKKKGKSKPIQVSPELHLAITEMAAKEGISQREAADKIYFGPLGSKKQTSITPIEAQVETEDLGEPPEIPEPGDAVSGELTKTVKDLRNIYAIKGLSQGLSGNEKKGEEKVTTKDGFELKKIQAMFGGGNEKKQSIDIQATLQSFQTNILAQMKALLAETETQRSKQDADFLRKRLEEKEAAEQRAAEMATAMEPIYKEVSLLSQKMDEYGKKLEPESKTPPTSAELEAIRTLGAGIKDAIVELSKKEGGTGGEKLSEYLDGLLGVMDKITEFSKRGETPPGDFDWRTAGISTFGEVTTEAIKAYRDIATGKGEGSEEGGGGRPLSRKLIERRVFNYAMKNIAAGILTIDPYEAGKALGLTPNQVWGAVEALRKRGALQAKARQKNVETETEEIEEGEILPGVDEA